MTKQDVKDYLIDSLGYRDYELEGYTIEQLEGIVDVEGSLSDLKDYVTVNNNPDVPVEIFDIEVSDEVAMLYREFEMAL